MVPLLVLEVFPPVDFSMQAHACVPWRHLAPSLHLDFFCGKHFYFPCFFTFYGVQAALWQFDPEALEESDASHMQPCTESKDSGSS